MKCIKVKVTFIESLLGSSPSNEDIYRDFIGSKAPDASSVEDEVAALGVDEVIEKGMTVFPRTEDGKPFIYDYQVKGFFKDSCGGLREVKSTRSAKIKAYKKKIDKLIFVQPRKILLDSPGEMSTCQRPLRAMTMKGERISLAMSEELPAGTTAEFSILCLEDDYADTVIEWLDYGILAGFGQWRNSGKGRFTYEVLE